MACGDFVDIENASYYYGYDILDICQTGLIEITLIFTYSSMGAGEVKHDCFTRQSKV